LSLTLFIEELLAFESSLVCWIWQRFVTFTPLFMDES